MSSIVHLTLHDGKRIGLPPSCAIILMDLSGAPPENAPAAQAFIRYQLAPQDGGRIALVRDSFRQLLNLFPRAMGEKGWLHAEDTKTGNAIAFPEGSICSYEEAEEGFALTLDVPTGPVSIPVKGNYEVIMAMMGESVPAPANDPAEAAQPPRRRRRNRGQ